MVRVAGVRVTSPPRLPMRRTSDQPPEQAHGEHRPAAGERRGEACLLEALQSVLRRPRLLALYPRHHATQSLDLDEVAQLLADRVLGGKLGLVAGGAREQPKSP